MTDFISDMVATTPITNLLFEKTAAVKEKTPVKVKIFAGVNQNKLLTTKGLLITGTKEQWNKHLPGIGLIEITRDIVGIHELKD